MKDARPPLFRIKISTKFVAVIALLLILVIVSISWMTAQPFLSDNQSLVMEINLEGAAGIAAKTNAAMMGLIDRSKSFGKALLESNSLSESAISAQFFEKNPKLLAAYVIDNAAIESETWIPTHQAFSERFEQYEERDGNGFVRGLAENSVLNKASMFSDEIQIALAPSSKNKKLFVVAFPFIKMGETYSHALILVLNGEFMSEIISDSSGVAGYIVDKNGALLAKTPELEWNLTEKLSDRDVVRQALESKLGNGQLRFVDRKGEAKLGVFRALDMGALRVITEVPESRAFEASKKATIRIGFFSVIILLVSLMIGLYFADSLTYPIGELVRASHRIGQGDFSIMVPIQSNDEMALLSSSFNNMARGLEDRERIKDLFNKFHNKEIAQEILNGHIPLGGERKQVVIFFSDIRGFTGMCESMEPESVVEMLNEYMSVMVGIVSRHHGIVDKFVGDAIMALWGIPNANPLDAERAVQAALDMREALNSLNELRSQRKQSLLKVGMGLHLGPVVAGNIGSDQKMEYTVVGDSVNLASRIESLTKDFDTDILISKALAEQTKNSFIHESCGFSQVKGKTNEVEVFKVLGRKFAAEELPEKAEAA